MGSEMCIRDRHNITNTVFDSALFLNTKKELSVFFRGNKKKYHHTTFYTGQRKLRNLLIESDGKPTGGKWTFDTENRKKYPARKTPPFVKFPDNDPFYTEAVSYVETHFSGKSGKSDKTTSLSFQSQGCPSLVPAVSGAALYGIWSL